jgi:RNA polymerase sigma factor (sigma-70 family)
MASEHDISPSGAPGRFPATQYSAVLALKSGDQAERERALETISKVYWRPVYTHIRLRWNRESEEASDLTQGFFVEVLEREFFASFDPQRAKFRTFLRVCLDRFVQREDASATRQKRGGGAEHVPLDISELESSLSSSARSPSPEDNFEREWVRSLLTLATARLRAHCDEAQRATAYRAFELYDLAPSDNSTRPTYLQLANALGTSSDDITNQLAYARKEFRRIVLELLRAMTTSEQEFRDEARALLGIDIR